MSKGTRSAAKSSAQEILSVRGAPAGLNDFLAGFTTETSGVSHSGESTLLMHLKLMNKSSEITKQKSLREINSLLNELEESIIIRYVSNIINMIMKHSHYPHPTVRAGVYTVLLTLMRKGKAVKQGMARELANLSGPWLMAIHDSERSVQQEAVEAFNTAFSPEKRTVMMLNYKDDILNYCFQKIELIMNNNTSQLSDSELDANINSLYSALLAMGYLIRQVSASQAQVMGFLEHQVLQKLIPQKGKVSGKDKLLVSSPQVRAGALSLLRDVVTVCPATPTIHQLVARALDGSIMDMNVFTAKRVWELLLFWCRTGGTSIISYFPVKFLDTVVDCMMKCQSEDLAEVIFPSICPLLAQLSKDARCAGVVDEFCGALIEKVHIHIDNPILSYNELSLVSKSLMSCWELHTIRNANSNKSKDSLELFTVIVLNFSELLLGLNKHVRYLEAIGGSMASSLLKTLIRSEDTFKECMRILCGARDAAFVVFPPRADQSPSSEGDTNPEQGALPSTEGYVKLQNATIGLMRKDVATETTYTRWIPKLEEYFQENIRSRLCDGDLVGAAMTVGFASATVVPSKDTVQLIVCALRDVFEKWVTSSDDETLSVKCNAETVKASTELLTAALKWKHNYSGELEFAGLINAAEAVKNVPEIQKCVQEYMMEDSDKLIGMLCTACRTANYDSIERYILHMERSKDTAIFSTEEQQMVLEAVADALQNEFIKLQEVKEDGENEAGRIGGGDDLEEGKYMSEEAGTTDELHSVASLEHSESGEVSKSNTQGSPMRGKVVSEHLQRWCLLLHQQTGIIGVHMGEIRRKFFAVVGGKMLQLLSAVSPCLYPEYYLSMKALRIALEDTEDDLADAMEEKTHYITTQQFHTLSDHVRDLMSSYEVSSTMLDQWYESFWNRLLDGEGEIEEEDDAEAPLPMSLLAAHQLQYMILLASPKLVGAIVSSQDVWESFRVLPVGEQDMEILFDGHYTVDQMSISLYPAVRTSQMIRLMDYCVSHHYISAGSAVKDTEKSKDEKLQAIRVFVLLRAALTQELYSVPIYLQLHKLLRTMILQLTNPIAVKHLVKLITQSEDPHCDQLMCVFASVLRAMAGNLDSVERITFSHVIPPIVGQLTEYMMDQTFNASGALGISAVRAGYFTIFFQLLDKTADVLHADFLSPISKEKLSLFSEVCCELVSFDCVTVKMCLIFHRHLKAKLEIPPQTVKVLIQYAQRQSIMDGLEVLTELSCCRVVDPVAFGELVRSILHGMCRSYTLRHLPTNGRLMKAGPQQASVNFKYLWRVVLSAIRARRGVILHSRMDDVLRGTVNLIIYDAVCECVTHLRGTNKADVPLLVRLIASTVEFLNDLQPEDVSVLRASESSTHTIASMFVFVYLWLSATPVAKLEAIGTEIVASVMRAACQLGYLTLLDSGIPLIMQLDPMISKWPTKPLRTKFSSAEPAKLRAFRRLNTLLRKTHKHKLALFPYLLGWGAFLTNTAPASPEATQIINRANICSLLDVLVALMMSPRIPGSSRLEDIYITGLTSDSSVGDGSRPPSPSVAKRAQLSALTCTDSSYVMDNLAIGSDAVFRLLLNGRTLAIIKDWMDTVEKKVQDMVSQFVHLHISHDLVQHALQDVLQHSPDGKSTFTVGDSMTVEVNLTNAFVGLEYEVEDERLTVRISFPPEYPLSPPRVEYRNEKEYGVSWKKWRSWMMKMSAKLFGGGMNVWDCIVLFQRNVDAHFEGLEPCPICFAVVSAVDNKIPELTCSACHNSKFHGSCLYTWWANGGANICPLCRAPWVA